MNLFKRTKFAISVLLMFLLIGCSTTFTTTGSDGDTIEIPKTLGYTVKVMQSTHSLYDAMMRTTNDFENNGTATYSQVEKVLVIANKYAALQNTAQKGVDVWFNAVVDGKEAVDKNVIVMSVLKLVAVIPELVTDANTILGADLKVPAILNLGSLMEVVNKDGDISINSDDLIVGGTL